MKDRFQFNTIAKAIRFLQAKQQEQPSLEEVAKHIHLSKYHFQRLFRQWAGISPKDFLQYLTIEKAKKALERGKTTLETSYQVGLSGNGRLHDLFIKIEACSPGEFKKQRQGLPIQYDLIETAFGPAIVAETPKGICKLAFVEDPATAEDQLKRAFPKAILIKGLGEHGQRVEQYFQNWEIPTTKIGLDLQGTAFQIQVWKALLQIPSAQLLSYQNVASSIDNPNAVRAVGTAIGKNPIAYLIPCHRVIKNNGEMGNYHWQPERKIAIHAYESLHLCD